MLDKARLGTRYTCFKCGCKFYDLNRPVPSCPDCQADQREAPARDIRSLLGKGGPVRKYADEDDDGEAAEAGEEDEELGLLGGIEEDDDEEDDVEMDDDEEMIEGESGGGGGGGEEDE